MSDWLHNLPVTWMAVIVFAATYLLAAVIYGVVNALAVGERARVFKATSPGVLPPLGILFGLFVPFLRRRYGVISGAPKRLLPAKRARSARSWS